ncbi:ArsR/SmtB family transcription factor [Virgisporangium aurantiacum]|uniref:Transcriptional regulator n=1 Tax=Virgisporangium aurantiacum TaxID=175570 RepID=A0A8J4E6W9_9ACTN|nr:helix-turn-helix domain-containing protein [Virgisporangium aurantiacum]GIJ64525.1 transcriptional regulator [Virgisporangium aurantiacum]
MLRLRFSPSDLGRVRLRGTLGPLVETLLALQTLGSRDLGPYGEWRRRVLARLPSVAAAARSLPPGAAAGLYAQAGPAATVEQAMLALRRSHTSGRREHGRLAALLAVSYESGIAPNWPAMLAHLDAEYANRARVLAEGGIDRLFGTLHPGLWWRPPVLELHGPSVGGDHDLAGRGLDVVPAVFCLGVPEIFLPVSGPAVLIYPAGADPATTPRSAPADAAVPDGLADLLGQTRAAVLVALAGGSTTGELARKLRISPAGASQHATVLRRAGLILSTRRGNSVLHTLTPLGSALLNRP